MIRHESTRPRIPNERRIRAFTLIESLVAIGVMCLLVAILLPAVQAARESARRARCMANFAQIGQAVQNYATWCGYFPPGSIHWTSSLDSNGIVPRVAVEFSMFTRILPQIERNSLFDSINFSNSIVPPDAFGNDKGLWIESRANETASTTKLDILLCPSDSAVQPALSAGTNLRSNDGTNPLVNPFDFNRLSGPSGPVYVSAGSLAHSSGSTTVASVTDGLSQTALLSEKLRSQPNSGDRQTPSRFDPKRDFIAKIELLGTRSADEIIGVCVDPATRPLHHLSNSGHNWMIGSLIFATYNHLALPNSPFADCVSGDTGLSSSRSAHPGGVNVGLADGSVRFIRNGVSLEVWRALGTKAAGEAISLESY